ncbi:MAG: arsenate-mycothiol transferase ArsC, partial [Promethearchaeota archaeon]
MEHDKREKPWDPVERKQHLLDILKALKNKDEIRILFICLGNICRSPYAEVMFEKMVNETAGCRKKFYISSGGFISNANLHEFTRRALLENGVPRSRIDRFQPRAMRRHKSE